MGVEPDQFLEFDEVWFKCLVGHPLDFAELRQHLLAKWSQKRSAASASPPNPN